ncbi:MAG: extracellular solute-binding protein [Ruminococcus sp.]|nr:extracellular solute-binding protein [Ruminococcus sp.]MCM1380513.1 extracellular solute-binding protein [Muribaculaceae bacterium]MCM1478871.1 extracellular solute-binding protein [Muribaculaceae bacterium]
MKNLKKTIAFVSAIALMGTFAACSDDGAVTETTTVSTAPKELDEEDKAAVEQIDMSGAEKLENGTVKWLSWYDINPADNKPKLAALELFENNYGGKIEYLPTTYEDRFTQLSTLVLGGSSPDIFPGQEGDTFPERVLSGMFEAWDDYLDFNDADLWTEGAKKLSDVHTMGGKHYLVATTTDSKCIMIYNKKTIEENGLDDPAELLANNAWDWNAFRKMCVEFCDREQDKFAYDSWYFETNLLLTTGVAPISTENGLLKSNLTSAEIERAENFMYDLKKDDLPLPKAEFNWEEQPQRMSEGKTLFYPIGTWALWEADLSAYGTMDEIMFVPMPKDPEADNYYLPASMDAYVLCKGAQNPEGAAAFMKCKLISAKDENALSIEEKQYRTDYGWTDEMVDMWYTVRELTDENPVINIHMGLASDVAKAVDDGLKQTSFNGTDWAVTRESISGMAQISIDETNAKIQEGFAE